jgi:hypothetical protein
MPIQNVLGGFERPILTVSAARTLGLNDANTFLLCTGATAFTVTVPADATTNFEIGTEFDITQDGTGAITIAAATGVSIFRIGSTATTGHILMGQYAVAMLKKISANSWRIYGGVSY